MSGFKNELINKAFNIGVVNTIIAHLTKCSKLMADDCIKSDNLLKNDEDIITNRLAAKYLNTDYTGFRYEVQSSENFDDKTNSFIGRTDIKVISSDYLHNAQAYFIIECKRIDGTDNLNKKYITEGVARFFSPTPTPKYSSYYMQNIMFGYIVQSIDIPSQANKIDKLQSSLLKDIAAINFELKQHSLSQYYVYVCKYVSAYIGEIELSHLFFNFADAICKK